jgi:hypothetical protein
VPSPDCAQAGNVFSHFSHDSLPLTRKVGPPKILKIFTRSPLLS